MKKLKLKQARHDRRKLRVRASVLGTPERPRLTVFRSLQNIGAQLVDDLSGQTLCAASTLDKALNDQVKYGGNCKAAVMIGQAIAERARMKGIKRVAFDRNGRQFHGRVKALAEAARKSGLEF